MTEWLKMTWEDQTMSAFLGSLDPAVGRFPHCLMRASRANFETILDHVSETPLWLGAQPLERFIHLVPKIESELKL